MAGDAVPTPLDRQRELMVAGMMHGHDDIISPRALDDRRRPPIDHGVEDPPRSVVALVAAGHEVDS